jgi:aldehyde dehydrogenase (NAD+)
VSANSTKFYIDGEWVDPVRPNLREIINPATEEVVGRISGGSAADVDRAVAAARRAFPAFAATTVEERIALLKRIIEVVEPRLPEFSATMTAEMGSPVTFCNEVQIFRMMENFHEMITTLRKFEFEWDLDGSLIRREPIGVCGLITPWNWPLASVVNKLGTALAAGCTSVLKPSEFAPLGVIRLMELLHEAGVPKGVVNLINGEGSVVGDAIARHPDVDMVSFTGSTRAGILVAKAAADTVKHIVQELGGKSANIILPDADLEKAVSTGVNRAFMNSSQSCQAPTRMLVHRSQRQAAIDVAVRTVEKMRVGDPLDPNTTMDRLSTRRSSKKFRVSSGKQSKKVRRSLLADQEDLPSSTAATMFPLPSSPTSHRR